MRPARLQAQGNDVRALKAMLDAELDDDGGQLVVFAVRVQAERRPDGVSKVEARNLLECRRNVRGHRARGLRQRQHRGKSDAGLFLLFEPDHRNDGRTAQRPGRSSAGSRAFHRTVQLSFRRDGSIFGKPRVNYVKPMNSSSAQAITESIFKALDACLPLRFTPRLAANIAGQVFVIRFVAP
jgi:hypothetical protein